MSAAEHPDGQEVFYEPPPGLPPDAEEAADGVANKMRSYLARLVQDVRDYQLTHGHVLKMVRFQNSYHVPSTGINVSLAPTPFPRRLYDEAVALQHCMNELYIKAAADEAWLYSVLRPEIEGDKDGLLASLWDVHMKCKEAGSVQDVKCGLFRSDYMLHGNVDGNSRLKQVEMNTFSVAGGCHSERVSDMHGYLRRKRGYEQEGRELSAMQMNLLPRNTNIASMTAGLTAAHYKYLETHPKLADNPANTVLTCVLMVVQPLNFNVADERPIEYGLWEANVPCYRCEWHAILAQTRLDENRHLIFMPAGSSTEFEVSVVYYKGGYDPAEYGPEADGKSTRLMLEMSYAIKCPDILTHLTTFKAVQQALAEPGVAESFLASPQTVNQRAAVRDKFMPMYPLGATPSGREARRLATDPREVERYVLKPNLEGGGHNVFGSDIPDFLSGKPEDHWYKYILQRRIEPPTAITGALLMAEELYEGAVVSELGILGFVMWKQLPSGGNEVTNVETVRNEAAGWTFKTKPQEINEMSVVKGYGCFDCPLLV
ncbi:hypothetical protein BAUCODRAFT_552460 [Baudoinia panamericana UAMH 10762]|uniref:Glutathione synthetase n=1 Tax=Baudoinia panamericana (strain UAMH 10762) TaxID=717646 RepID=M2LK27_BAUPA|nr:uncharacterized protein BAUCODRAFT_552460 [Baudoinia panamericana UAMH 10762]EMC94587.1 hypothetical protein BAUCODRAFT_552460 [Baudoinia panamericana UAMH 10762]